MRAIVNAILSYGLVNVPVGVATAVKDNDMSFKTLHHYKPVATIEQMEGQERELCLSPVKQLNQCPACGVDVNPDDTVKGYEVAKGVFAALDAETLKGLKGERAKVITIDKFVPFDQIDDLTYDKTYWLDPNENPALATPYALLAWAMTEEQVVGIGTQSLWGKESPCAVWVHPSGALAFSTIHCAEDVVSSAEIVAKLPILDERFMEKAVELVSASREDLVPEEDLVSPGRVRVAEYVNSVVAGIDFTVREPEKQPEATLASLYEALDASILESKKKRGVAA